MSALSGWGTARTRADTVRTYSKCFIYYMVTSIKRFGVMHACQLSPGSNRDKTTCLAKCMAMNKNLYSYDSVCLRRTMYNLHFITCKLGGIRGYQPALTARRGSAKLRAKHVEPKHCASQDSCSGVPPLIARKSISHIWLPMYSLFRYA